MMPGDQRLAALWPFVRDQLPPAPASVLEIGCGQLGGFVPALVGGGYDAIGVDPEAPEGPSYRRVEFERYESPRPVNCVVASASLHHVADLDEVLGRVQATLVPDGVLVVMEWAWERFDEATARWCFDRLAPPNPAEEPGWLHRHLDQWTASGQPWEAYRRAWAGQEGLHAGQEILRQLDARFERRLSSDGPYFFADLAGTPPHGRRDRSPGSRSASASRAGETPTAATRSWVPNATAPSSPRPAGRGHQHAPDPSGSSQRTAARRPRLPSAAGFRGRP